MSSRVLTVVVAAALVLTGGGATVIAAGERATNGSGAARRAAASGTAGEAQIAFSSAGRVALMDPDGSGLRFLTPAPRGAAALDATEPAWSPDGRTIAFVHAVEARNGDSRAQIYLVGSGGGAPRPLEPALAAHVAEQAPAWSPDGRQIAFARFVDRDSAPQSAIVVADASGADEHTIVSQPFDAKALAYVFAPAWSPDGSRILYTRSTVDKSSHFASTLNSVSASGGTATQLASDAGPAAFSPDGSRIAFVSTRDHNGERCGEDECNWAGEIYVMNADGSNSIRLTSEKGDDERPSWSPDGRYIAFASDRNYPLGEHPEIYVMNADGSCLTWLTNGTADSRTPAWGPGNIAGSPPCDASDRAPLIATDVRPAMRFHGFPLYWLGGESRNLVVTQASAARRSGAFFEYDDCQSFDARRCPAPVQIEEAFICSPDAVLDDALALPLRRARLRGALAADLGQGSVWIYTGRTAIHVDARLGSPALRGLVAALIPLHGRSTATLPPPRFPTWLVREVDQTVSLYRRLGSVAAVGRALHVSRSAVRDRLRYARVIHSFRPLRELRCAHRLRPAPPALPRPAPAQARP